MERPKKAKGSASAFNFCNALNVVLAAAACMPNGGCCQQERVYLPRINKIIFKDRVAKPAEIKEPEPTAFELRDVPRQWKRTAKHKRFITDTGATISVTNRADIFLTIDDYAPNKRVQVANGQFVEVLFTGTVQLDLRDRRGKKPLLWNVSTTLVN